MNLRAEVIVEIRRLLENNLGRPLSPRTLYDTLDYPRETVRRAIWRGVDNGHLQFTDDRRIGYGAVALRASTPSKTEEGA